MNKLAAIVIALILCVATRAFAQVTITPDPGRLRSGDYLTDLGLSRVTLTPEQKDQLRPICEQSLKETETDRDAVAEKLKDITPKLKAMQDAAKKNGTLADLANDPQYKALEDKQNSLWTETGKAAKARHQRVTDEVMKLLTTAQKRAFLRETGPASGDPKHFLTSGAMTEIEHWAPGIDLPDDKYNALLDKLTDMIKKYDADTAATGETDYNVIGQWWRACEKKMRAVVDESLTEEQKQQAAANRLARYQKTCDEITAMVVKSIDRGDPTPQQKARAAELAAAVHEKMLQLDPEATDRWGALYFQLRQDVDQILNDEQRQKRDTPVQVKIAPDP